MSSQDFPEPSTTDWCPWALVLALPGIETGVSLADENRADTGSLVSLAGAAVAMLVGIGALVQAQNSINVPRWLFAVVPLIPFGATHWASQMYAGIQLRERIGRVTESLEPGTPREATLRAAIHGRGNTPGWHRMAARVVGTVPPLVDAGALIVVTGLSLKASGPALLQFSMGIVYVVLLLVVAVNCIAPFRRSVYEAAVEDVLGSEALALYRSRPTLECASNDCDTENA